MKLAESLERRGVAPHICESAEDAQSNLRRLELGAAH
jgi:propionate CoA-transferase